MLENMQVFGFQYKITFIVCGRNRFKNVDFTRIIWRMRTTTWHN